MTIQKTFKVKDYAEYDAINAINMSKLKDIKKSPYHFWANHLSPNKQKTEETEALRFGTLCHKFVLEHKDFYNDYVIAPKFDKRTKIGKADYEQFVFQHLGKLFTDQEEINIVTQMRAALMRKQASFVLFKDDAIYEQAMVWNDNGVACKAKLDLYIPPCKEYPNGIIVDYKTCQSAKVEDFTKSAFNFGYHNSAAYYSKGFQQVFKTDGFPIFIFAAQEKEAPYETAFYTADDAMLNFGLQENAVMLNLYKQCLTTKQWEGYKDEILPLSLPYWVNK